MCHAVWRPSRNRRAWKWHSLKLQLATSQSGIKENQDRNWNVPADSDIHRYDSQGRGNYQTRRHRTLVYEQLPS